MFAICKRARRGSRSCGHAVPGLVADLASKRWRRWHAQGRRAIHDVVDQYLKGGETNAKRVAPAARHSMKRRRAGWEQPRVAAAVRLASPVG